MIDLALFRIRPFSAGLASVVVAFAGLFTATFLLPFLLEQGRGFSPIEAGLLLTPVPITMALVAPLSGMASDRFGPRVLASAGMAIMVLGLLSLTQLPVDFACRTSSGGSSCWDRPGHVHEPQQQRGARLRAAAACRDRVGTLAQMRVNGQALGIALSGAIVATRLPVHLAELGAMVRRVTRWRRDPLRNAGVCCRVTSDPRRVRRWRRSSAASVDRDHEPETAASSRRIGARQHLGPRPGRDGQRRPDPRRSVAGRFILGLGVSHAPLVKLRGHDYERPYSAMRHTSTRWPRRPGAARRRRCRRSFWRLSGPGWSASPASATAGAYPYFSHGPRPRGQGHPRSGAVPGRGSAGGPGRRSGRRTDHRRSPSRLLRGLGQLPQQPASDRLVRGRSGEARLGRVVRGHRGLGRLDRIGRRCASVSRRGPTRWFSIARGGRPIRPSAAGVLNGSVPARGGSAARHQPERAGPASPERVARPGVRIAAPVGGRLARHIASGKATVRPPPYLVCGHVRLAFRQAAADPAGGSKSCVPFQTCAAQR
jgi:hypothetical protein